MTTPNLPKIKNTTSHTANLKFRYDDGLDEQLFTILTPARITNNDVARILHNTHQKLIKDDYYTKHGYDTATLLSYINKKYGWEYKRIDVDVDVEVEFD